MIRFEKYLEIIEEEKLVDNAARMGEYLLGGLGDLQKKFPALITNVRGRGLLCAFDLPDSDTRNQAVKNMKKHGMIILSCGKRSIRSRPRLNVTKDEIDEALKIMHQGLKEL
jgi:L-lysine 6-transaminase